MHQPAERDGNGANGGIKAGSLGMLLHTVPIAKVGAARCSIVDDDVVGVSDPEDRGGDVIVTEAGGGSDEGAQVVLEGVVGLYAILQEKRSTHDVVQNLKISKQHFLNI